MQVVHRQRCFFADPPVETALTGAIVEDGMAFRQIEFAGILQGTKHEAAAQVFIDFLISQSFQEDMPLNMFVFPVNMQADLPDVFIEYATLAETPAEVDYIDINDYRETWIEQWAEAILR